MQTVKDLKQTIPQRGRIEWIGTASERMADIVSHQKVELKKGTGIVGEHHANSGKSKRQLTLIQAEHLPMFASILGKPEVAPALLRRNVVVSGINLQALKDLPFRIGPVMLHGSGPCPPCSRMEMNLGEGGYATMIGHGGICAIVESDGEIQVGDEVVFTPNPEQ